MALGYDGDWNCLLSFKNISNMSQQSGLSRISTAPSRVCLCNETGQPDCLTVADPTTRVMYPRLWQCQRLCVCTVPQHYRLFTYGAETKQYSC